MKTFTTPWTWLTVLFGVVFTAATHFCLAEQEQSSATAAPAITAAPDVPETLEYNRDIRPILADACFACHGPDSASRKADLRLDQRDAAIEHGALVPSDPDGSELLRRVLSDDPDEAMPPPETKKTLSARQRDVLKRWIAQGAEYQLHWSLIAPVRPAIPQVSQPAWVRNPIDAFVLAKLDALKLKPADEADRRTLARRVSLDLTGLPPNPADVEAFVNDQSADAYEKYVDALLDTAQWGEHRARYWLDYARYADTHGIHFDNFREMWSYRDWVIKAFQQNMPFDQFTIENLAGDLLPDCTLDQRIGSGFNRCNMTTNEGGIIDEEYKVLYARDRTETTSLVWMGLTAGCAVCHSHKFDPLSQQEFYELTAFFNNTTQPVRDGNVKDTPPIVTVPLATDRERWGQLPALIEQAKSQVAARRAEGREAFTAWASTAAIESLGPAVSRASLHLEAKLDEGTGETVKVCVDDQCVEYALGKSSKWAGRFIAEQPALQVQGEALSITDAANFASDQAFTCSAWIKVPANDGTGAICARMDTGNRFRGWDLWLQARRIGTHIIDAWPDNALKVVGREQVPANQWVHVCMTYDGSSKAAGVHIYYDGVEQAKNVENNKLTGSIQTSVSFKIGQRESSDAFTGEVRDLRLYRRALAAGEVSSLARTTRVETLLAKPAAERNEAETNELFEFWLATLDGEYQTRATALQELEAEKAAISARGTIAHVMQEKPEDPTAFVLYRGEYDQRRDQVSPSTPKVLPAFPDEFPRNRLGLARWLLLPDHPLTARVTVNRFWQEVFGTGIVKSTGDFGVSGDLPVNPELLDWLAIEFRESGWDVKQLFKLMVMSATYRQSAAATPEKVERDPENRYLSRGPRFRMDAELVRDSALSVSGLLVKRIGGPSVKPYQPPGVWEAIAMNVSNTRSYTPDTGESLYRRSLYTFVKRMAPPAAMDIFNAPNREICVVRRERTNTPLQALCTLNDEQFVEAARHLAMHAIDGADSFEGRVQFMGQRLLSRDFRSDELQIIENSFAQLLAHYTRHAGDAQELLTVGESPTPERFQVSELAAWTMLANELMNLDEFLNK
ncbi:MAG: DUF1553 domain-containing protein [Planctomycetales bacterium]|nr:DUF1553 domain-containing protein [Planctomycetales bacterium]MCA9168974.1 DUF1553 domain-containing protein [Planctomycetales bacterium]